MVRERDAAEGGSGMSMLALALVDMFENERPMTELKAVNKEEEIFLSFFDVPDDASSHAEAQADYLDFYTALIHNKNAVFLSILNTFGQSPRMKPEVRQYLLLTAVESGSVKILDLLIEYLHKRPGYDEEWWGDVWPDVVRPVADRCGARPPSSSSCRMIRLFLEWTNEEQRVAMVVATMGDTTKHEAKRHVKESDDAAEEQRSAVASKVLVEAGALAGVPMAKLEELLTKADAAAAVEAADAGRAAAHVREATRVCAQACDVSVQAVEFAETVAAPHVAVAQADAAEGAVASAGSRAAEAAQTVPVQAAAHAAALSQDVATQATVHDAVLAQAAQAASVAQGKAIVQDCVAEQAAQPAVAVVCLLEQAVAEKVLAGMAEKMRGALFSAVTY